MSVIVHISEGRDASWYWQYAVSHSNESHIMYANMIEAANRNHEDAIYFIIENIKDVVKHKDDTELAKYIRDSCYPPNGWSYMMYWYFHGCCINSYLDSAREYNNPLAIIHYANQLLIESDIRECISYFESHFQDILKRFPYILLPTYGHLATSCMTDDDELDIYHYIYSQYDVGMCPQDIVLRMAEIMTHREQPDDALAFLNELLLCDLEEYELVLPYYLMADCYYILQEYEKSWQYAHMSLECGGGLHMISISEPVYHIGHMYFYVEQYKDWDMAKTYFEKAIEIDNCVDALMSLATYYSENDIDDKAIELLEQAYEFGACLTASAELALLLSHDIEKSWIWIKRCFDAAADDMHDVPENVWDVLFDIISNSEGDIQSESYDYLRQAYACGVPIPWDEYFDYHGDVVRQRIITPQPDAIHS